MVGRLCVFPLFMKIKIIIYFLKFLRTNSQIVAGAIETGQDFSGLGLITASELVEDETVVLSPLLPSNPGRCLFISLFWGITKFWLSPQAGKRCRSITKNTENCVMPIPKIRKMLWLALFKWYCNNLTFIFFFVNCRWTHGGHFKSGLLTTCLFLVPS